MSLNAGFAASNDSSNKAASKWEGSNQLTTNTTKNLAAGSNGTTINIKVLIYSGPHTAYSCVNGIKTSLKTANTKKLVPEYTFTYATSTVINSATLSGYDLLAMPGGTSGYNYMHSGSISATAIKNFVKSGKGYLGICAGAYAGSYQVYGYYYGWGLAPHVKSTHPNHEGDLTVQITSKGKQLLNTTGNVTIAHYNGGAMYASSQAIVFATYADNIIKSKGMAAIVGDYYGKGRVVLSGPHPELEPQLPKVVANLVVWAANKTKPDPTNVATRAQIASAAATVKTYYEKNKALPGSVTINGSKISMSQFTYLLSRGIVNINSGFTSSITIKSVNVAPKPSGSYKSGNIKKSAYISLAKNMVNFINKNGRVPNYQSTSLGKIPFTKLVYMYSKIINFYKTNKRLPNYVSM
ncbi:MAG TPA: BPL-N domain-containing protein [Methanobacterium sp.]